MPKPFASAVAVPIACHDNALLPRFASSVHGRGRHLEVVVYGSEACCGMLPSNNKGGTMSTAAILAILAATPASAYSGK